MVCLRSVGLFCLIAFGGFARADEGADRQQIFARLDSLGYAKVISGPFFRVTTLDKSQSSSPDDSSVIYGFLLQRTPSRLRIFGPDFGQCFIPLDDPLTAVQIDEVSPRTQIETEVKNEEKHWAATGSDAGVMGWTFEEPLFYAYWAEKAGDEALSKRLFGWAEKIASTEQRQHMSYRYIPKNKLVPDFEHLLGVCEFNEILNSIYSGEEAWPEIRRRFEEFLARFPNHWRESEAKEMIASIDETIRYAEQHAAPVSAGRTDSLIFQLRNQREEEDPSESRDVHHPAQAPQPEELLAKVGFEAIPALITATTDPQLTHYHGPYELTLLGDSPLVPMRVGDIARSLIENELTADAVRVEPRDNESWLDEQKRYQSAALKWWGENKSKSEFQRLSERVESWPNASSAAQTLAERYPDRAASVLRVVLGKGDDPYVRSFVALALGSCQGKEAEELARQLMSTATELQV